jgi:hypothetical protein
MGFCNRIYFSKTFGLPACLCVWRCKGEGLWSGHNSGDWYTKVCPPSFPRRLFPRFADLLDSHFQLRVTAGEQ